LIPSLILKGWCTIGDLGHDLDCKCARSFDIERPGVMAFGRGNIETIGFQYFIDLITLYGLLINLAIFMIKAWRMNGGF
jgi:hypothetical protein